MEERERKRFTKILRTVGEESPLNKVPRNLAVGAQIPARPVVPPFGPVLPVLRVSEPQRPDSQGSF